MCGSRAPLVRDDVVHELRALVSTRSSRPRARPRSPLQLQAPGLQTPSRNSPSRAYTDQLANGRFLSDLALVGAAAAPSHLPTPCPLFPCLRLQTDRPMRQSVLGERADFSAVAGSALLLCLCFPHLLRRPPGLPLCQDQIPREYWRDAWQLTMAGFPSARAEKTCWLHWTCCHPMYELFAFRYPPYHHLQPPSGTPAGLSWLVCRTAAFHIRDKNDQREGDCSHRCRPGAAPPQLFRCLQGVLSPLAMSKMAAGPPRPLSAKRHPWKLIHGCAQEKFLQAATRQPLHSGEQVSGQLETASGVVCFAEQEASARAAARRRTRREGA